MFYASSDNKWHWVCIGPTSSAKNCDCSAPKIVNGLCGTAHGMTTISLPASYSLCTKGIPTGIAASKEKIVWTCAGSNEGISDSCFIKRAGVTWKE